jgi:hypothetical protein
LSSDSLSSGNKCLGLSGLDLETSVSKVTRILRDRLPERVIFFIIARPDFEWVAS